MKILQCKISMKTMMQGLQKSTIFPRNGSLNFYMICYPLFLLSLIDFDCAQVFY
jgi:hypothetical protein